MSCSSVSPINKNMSDTTEDLIYAPIDKKQRDIMDNIKPIPYCKCYDAFLCESKEYCDTYGCYKNSSDSCYD